MYEANGEKPLGLFGMFKRKTNSGRVPEGVEAVFNNGLDEVGLTVEPSDTLVIRSYGESPVRIEFRAQPQMEKPKVTVFLYPGNNEIRTGRSHITITPLSKEVTERIIVQGPEPKPLTLSDSEVRALIMGMGLMRPNVGAAYSDGRKSGLDEGYLQGSQPHPTNL